MIKTAKDMEINRKKFLGGKKEELGRSQKDEEEQGEPGISRSTNAGLPGSLVTLTHTASFRGRHSEALSGNRLAGIARQREWKQRSAFRTQKCNSLKTRSVLFKSLLGESTWEQKTQARAELLCVGLSTTLAFSMGLLFWMLLFLPIIPKNQRQNKQKNRIHENGRHCNDEGWI